MARSFTLFTLAAATAMVVLFAAGAMPASAEPASNFTPSAAPGVKQPPEVQEGFRLLSKGETTRAIRALETASRKYPELPTARVMMYEMFLQMKEPKAASLQLEEAVKMMPGDPEPYVILGNIAWQDQRVAEAAMDFDKAQQLLAQYTNAHRKKILEQQTMSGIAQVAESREDWKVAEARLQDLLKLAPEDLVAHQRLAHSLFWQGNAKDAYDVLKAAKKIDREIAGKNKTKEVILPPEAIMAQYYDQWEGPKSQTGNAEKWFKAALRLAPENLPTRQVVAIWALENGKIAFAKEQAEAALKIESDSRGTVGRMLRGQVALWEEDWPEAERNFKAAIDENPNDFAARKNLALALVEQNDPAKKQRALDYAEATYRDNKNDPDALSTLGWVHFRRNEFDQAGLFLDQAIKAIDRVVKAARGEMDSDIMRSGLNMPRAKAIDWKMDPDVATYVAHFLYHQDKKWQAKEILDTILETDRAFSMRPEAKDLYEKVKDEKNPEAAPATETPSHVYSS